MCLINNNTAPEGMNKLKNVRQVVTEKVGRDWDWHTWAWFETTFG